MTRALYERALAAAKELETLSSSSGASGVPPEDAKQLADQIAQCKAAQDECFLKSTQPKKKTKPRQLHSDDDAQDEDDEDEVVDGEIESTTDDVQGLDLGTRHEF